MLALQTFAAAFYTFSVSHEHDSPVHPVALSAFLLLIHLPWAIAQSFHCFTPVGSLLVTPATLPRYKCVVLRLDADVAQDSSAGDAGLNTEATLREAGPEVCACWLGPLGARFATGHQQGDVLLWEVPRSVLGAHWLMCSEDLSSQAEQCYRGCSSSSSSGLLASCLHSRNDYEWG